MLGIKKYCLIAAIAVATMLGTSAIASETDGTQDSEVVETIEMADVNDGTNAGSGETSVPRAVFTNTAPTTPNLYVQKTVQNADSRYPADEDAEFTFSLKLDGELAKKTTYTVTDETGQEVLKKENGITVPYKTDSNGRFKLKAGQTAMFEYVGAGVAYEVTEVSIPDDFTQISPAGAAVGTVEDDGTFVSFTNRYSPSIEPPIPSEDDPDDPETSVQTAKFSVEKQISFPSGYEYDTAQSFGFTLTVDGELFAGESYKIEGTSETGTTDENGHFSLLAGQTAVFDVPVNVDYKIEEDVSDEWSVYGGSRVKSGAVAYPVTDILFTNIQAAFGVSKTTDIASTDEFTFFLTDGDNKVMKGQKYLLYSSNGKRADDVTYETGTDGSFTLTSGQTAMFINIPEGTAYRVREQAQEGWEQVLPASLTGYSKNVVASVEILPFVNNKTEEDEDSLNVVKKVTATTDVLPDSSDEFSFILKCGDTPVANAVYSVASGSSTLTYKTDTKGKFSIKANQTAVFGSLESGKEYTVEETITDERYTIKESDRTRSATLDGYTVVSFTNSYTPKGKMTLTKVDSITSEPLENAVFNIYTNDGCTMEVASMVTDEDGVAVSELLPLGTYYVKESQAPEEHIASDDVYIVVLEKDNATVTVKDLEGNDTIKNDPANGNISIKKISSILQNGTDPVPIEGVVFGVYSTQDCAEASKIGELTTNEDGEAALGGVEAGTYYVKELGTPPGYLFSNTVYDVTVVAGETVTVEDPDYNDGYIRNMPVGKLTLTKVDADTEEPLEGAIFGIYKDEDCTDYSVLAKMTTDEEGKAVLDNILVGDYYVKETTAPRDHLLSQKVYAVSITGAGQTVDIEDNNFRDGYIRNKSTIGSIKLVKYDNDGSTPLAGVTFHIEGMSVDKSLTTDKNGEVLFEDLDPGDYMISETKTVAGHSLLAEPISVTLPLTMTAKEVWETKENIDIDSAWYDEGAELYYFYDLTYHVTNTANLDIPTTGGNGYPIILGVSGAAMILAVTLTVSRKRKKRS